MRSADLPSPHFTGLLISPDPGDRAGLREAARGPVALRAQEMCDPTRPRTLSSGGRASAAGFNPGFLTGGRDDVLGKADALPGDCASRIEAMLSAPADPKPDPTVTCRALP